MLPWRPRDPPAWLPWPVRRLEGELWRCSENTLGLTYVPLTFGERRGWSAFSCRLAPASLDSTTRGLCKALASVTDKNPGTSGPHHSVPTLFKDQLYVQPWKHPFFVPHFTQSGFPTRTLLARVCSTSALPFDAERRPTHLPCRPSGRGKGTWGWASNSLVWHLQSPLALAPTSASFLLSIQTRLGWSDLVMKRTIQVSCVSYRDINWYQTDFFFFYSHCSFGSFSTTLFLRISGISSCF